MMTEADAFGTSQQTISWNFMEHKTTTKTLVMIDIYVMGVSICSLIIQPCSERGAEVEKKKKKEKLFMELFPPSAAWSPNPSLSEPWKRTACTFRKSVTYSRLFI